MTSFSGYPRGWFSVGFSADLAPKEVRPIKYFGRDLVLFRTEEGPARVLDAHCPHLGAHLGYGGTVEGDSIRCPFHAWRFSGSTGDCVEVPYAKKIPLKARVNCWPVMERNGIILVHHDPSGAEPSYEIPVLDDYGHPDWLPWATSLFPMKTQPKEIVENIADKGHFAYVHKTDIDEFSFETDRHIARQSIRGRAHFGDKQEKIASVATYYGPGVLMTEMEGMLKNHLLVLTTPVDEQHVHLWFAVTLKKVKNAEQYMGMYLENLRLGFIQDQSVWENKIYRDKPQLCDGDGPIGKMRAWYKQFYADPTPTDSNAAA
jgi:phenylpropionate dioxygenase-like ring-hydroxylating dioxygenase large terminal subunit